MADQEPEARAQQLNAGRSNGKDGSVELLQRAFAELETSLEQLRMAEAEMRAQNEFLERAQELLTQERQRYENLFQFAPDGYLVTDLKGVIEEANQAAGRLLHLSPRTLRRKPLANFVAPDARPDFRRHLLQLPAAGRLHDVVLWFKPRNAPTVPVAITASVVRDAQNEARGVRWMLRDVSERVRAENEIRALNADLENRVRARTEELERALERERAERTRAEATEERLHLLVENARDYAMFLMDGEGRVVLWSAGAERIFGYSEEEMLGQPGGRIFTPEDRARGEVERELETARQTGRAEDTRWHVRKDGTRFFAGGVLVRLEDDQGRFRGFGKVLRDITDRFEARVAVEDSEKTLRAVFENALDALLIAGDDLRYLDVNPAACALFGLPREELLQRSIADFAAPDARPEVERNWRAFLETGTQEGEFPLRRPDGTVRWAEYRAIAHVLPGRHLSSLRDITERKRAEEERAQALERERRIAETLQRSLLIKPLKDGFPGLEIETVYEPALEEAWIGGDFFDVFGLEGGRTALVVADASGKGLAAAARTVEAKYALRTFLRSDPDADPGRALARLNDLLCSAERIENREGVEFVTLALAVINPRADTAAIAVAGAEPPILLRAAEGNATAEAVQAEGMVLGADRGQEYETAVRTIARGDTLLMITDGVTEARHGDDMLGLDRVMDLARREHKNASLEAMGATLLEAVRAFAHGTLRDDLCVLLARRK